MPEAVGGGVRFVDSDFFAELNAAATHASFPGNQGVVLDFRAMHRKIAMVVVVACAFDGSFGGGSVSGSLVDMNPYGERSALLTAAKCRTLAATAEASPGERACVALYKLYRVGQRWVVHCINAPGDTSTVSDSVRFMQTQLFDLLPALAHKPAALAVDSVDDVVRALTSGALQHLKKHFLWSRSGRGLDQRTFTDALARWLLRDRPELQEPAQAARLVAVAHELFSLVDVTGRGCIEWDAFTQFCISTHMSQTGDPCVDEVGEVRKHSYAAQDDFFPAAHRGSSVHRLKLLPALGRIVLLEEHRDAARLFFTNGQFDRLVSVAPEASAINSEIPSSASLMLFDVDYVQPPVDALAVAASDSTIRILRLLDNGESAVCWVGLADALVSVGSDHAMSVWDLDSGARTLRLKLHKDVISDALDLPDHEVRPRSPVPSPAAPLTDQLLATASFDNTIILWDTGVKFAHRATLRGHQKGVRTLSYANGILLSASFEYTLLTWDVVARKQHLKLRGHKAPLVGAHMLPESRLLFAVSLDAAGVARVWDVGRSDSSGNGLATPICHFDLPREAVQGTFCALLLLPSAVSRVAPTIVAAGTRIAAFQPRKRETLRPPPALLLHNPTGRYFLACGARDVHMWQSETMNLVRTYTGLTRSDITCAVLDPPRYGRLFAGLADGRVAVISYLTGHIVDAYRWNRRAVAALLFCEEDQTLIVLGAAGKLLVADTCEHTGTASIARFEEFAAPDFSCGAFSYNLALVATGSLDGCVRLYDYRTLGSVGIATTVREAEVTAAAFVDPYPLLVTADANGNALLWAVRPSTLKFACLRSFSTPASGAAINTVSVHYAGATHQPDFVVMGDEQGWLRVWDAGAALQGLGEVVHPVRRDEPVPLPRPDDHISALTSKLAARATPAFGQVPIEKQWLAHRAPIGSVVVFSGGHSSAVVSTSHDHRVRLWARDGAMDGDVLTTANVSGAYKNWHLEPPPDALRDPHAFAASEIVGGLERSVTPSPAASQEELSLAKHLQRRARNRVQRNNERVIEQLRRSLHDGKRAHASEQQLQSYRERDEDIALSARYLDGPAGERGDGDDDDDDPEAEARRRHEAAEERVRRSRRPEHTSQLAKSRTGRVLYEHLHREYKREAGRKPRQALDVSPSAFLQRQLGLGSSGSASSPSGDVGSSGEDVGSSGAAEATETTAEPGRGLLMDADDAGSFFVTQGQQADGQTTGQDQDQADDLPAIRLASRLSRRLSSPGLGFSPPRSASSSSFFSAGPETRAGTADTMATTATTDTDPGAQVGGLRAAGKRAHERAERTIASVLRKARREAEAADAARAYGIEVPAPSIDRERLASALDRMHEALAPTPRSRSASAVAAEAEAAAQEQEASMLSKLKAQRLRRQQMQDQALHAKNPFGPHYTPEEVLNFGRSFMYFDNDGNGTISIEEFLNYIDDGRDTQGSRRMFQRFDTGSRGMVTLRQLLLGVFSKAPVSMVDHMHKYIHQHIISKVAAAAQAKGARKQRARIAPELLARHRAELRQLFRLYDPRGRGKLTLAALLERMDAGGARGRNTLSHFVQTDDLSEIFGVDATDPGAAEVTEAEFVLAYMRLEFPNATDEELEPPPPPAPPAAAAAAAAGGGPPATDRQGKRRSTRGTSVHGKRRTSARRRSSRLEPPPRSRQGSTASSAGSSSNGGMQPRSRQSSMLTAEPGGMGGRKLSVVLEP